jgi:hypothetical protein
MASVQRNTVELTAFAGVARLQLHTLPADGVIESQWVQELVLVFSERFDVTETERCVVCARKWV